MGKPNIMGPDYGNISRTYTSWMNEIEMERDKELSSLRARIGARGVRPGQNALQDIVDTKAQSRVADLRTGYYGKQLQEMYTWDRTQAKPKIEIKYKVQTRGGEVMLGAGRDDSISEERLLDRHPDAEKIETNVNRKTKVWEERLLEAERINTEEYGGLLEEWEAYSIAKYGKG